MAKLSVLATLPFFFQLLNAQSFQPSSIKGFFVEQFNSDSLATWSPSEAIKEGYGTAKETMQYNGQWAVEAPTVYPGIPEDLGLVVKSAASHHAISVPFPNVLNPEVEFKQGGEALVVQYEVKLQKGLDCGGAYIKLLSEDEKGIQAQEFSDKTPYTIMFGPDRCGGTQKVHLIIRHKNPITGEITEKHLKNPPTPRTDKLSHLYTLIIKPDQTYEILIDEESQKTGSLLEDFDPPFNPPEEIDDPEDKKPEDWVDNARIPDPNAVKPDDWDEDAPRQIPDLDVEKPEDWLEEEPAMIPDPKAEKPEEWDDEEDGDWIAPSIPNPKCEDVSGCGEWKRPNKPNPDYKGKWSAPMIDNPDYIGVWKPRKIPNPDYYHDATPANLSPIAGIGIELWTMTDSILFDNFFISFSPSDAKKFASETFAVKKPIEEAAEEAERPAKEEIKFDEEVEWSEDPVGFAKNRLRTFVDKAIQDPVGAFKEMPQTGSVIVGGLVGLVGMLGVLMNIISASPAPAKVKKVATNATTEVSEKIEKAKATAVEAVEETKAKKRAGKAPADE